MRKDFLDVLRLLNKDNINSFPQKDEFFNSLMTNDTNVPEYFDKLSDEYYLGFEKQYSNSPVKNFMLSNLFGNEIKRQLTDNLIEDRETCLYVDSRSAAHALTYVGSVKGMKALIETSSDHFNFFKESILRGLITRYCNDIVRSKNSERLNKLIVIYAEHIRHIEPSNEIPIIIDEKFINDLLTCKIENGVVIDSKDSYIAVHRLIDRKFPINDKEISYYGNEGKYKSR